MSGLYRFFMVRVDGEVVRNLESDFLGLRYKEARGVNAYGQPRVYTEERVDDSCDDVFLTDMLKSTDFTLTLYFFGRDGLKNEAAYASAMENYHSFMDFILGQRLVYADTFRGRLIVIHLESAITPKQDRVRGVPFLECEFKFKNEYGRSFLPSQLPDGILSVSTINKLK